MRKLTLIRHAKSSHDAPGLPDHLRPLNPRGLRDAPLVGAHLKESRSFSPQLLICSPAVRTVETAKAIAAAVDYPPQGIRMAETIYEAPLEALVAVVRQLPGHLSDVCLVGHNPGMEWLTNWLCGTRAVDRFVTCAVASLELNIGEWASAAAGCARLSFFTAPALLGLTKETD